MRVGCWRIFGLQLGYTKSRRSDGRVDADGPLICSLRVMGMLGSFARMKRRRELRFVGEVVVDIRE